jgi:hypothetical protein
MPKIYLNHFDGGRALSERSSDTSRPSLDVLLRAIVTDLTALQTAITTLTAKLDAENVTNLDTDYAATCDPTLTMENG